MIRDADDEDLVKWNTPEWMVQLVRKNPSYTGWGPHEDYMWRDNAGWESRWLMDGWEGEGPISLDCYNEVVNFYFFVNRDSEQCTACKGTAYSSDAHNIMMHTWRNGLTQEELGDQHSVDYILSASHVSSTILHKIAKARCARKGLPFLCTTCEEGRVYTEDGCHLGLVLWVLHPRKGCSKGVEIKRISEEQVPVVLRFLREAATRNTERFSRL